MKKQIGIEIISFLLILLFMYAALSKVSDMEKFRAQVGMSPLLTNFVGFVVIFIPSIEVAISVLLAWQKYRLIGLYGALWLMALFTAYIIAITKFSEFIPCSCGGILQNMSWAEHLFFNIGFDILILIGIVLQTNISTSVKKTNEVDPKSILTAP